MGEQNYCRWRPLTAHNTPPEREAVLSLWHSSNGNIYVMLCQFIDGKWHEAGVDDQHTLLGEPMAWCYYPKTYKELLSAVSE
jgi:hypothetical protein